MKEKKEYVVAVDLGGTNLRCATVDEDCKIIRLTQRPAIATLCKKEIIANIKQGILETIDGVAQKKVELIGIGMGLPGIIDVDKGLFCKAVNFPNIHNVAIADLLNREFKLPVFIGHDVDMAVIGEKKYGAGRGKNHILCLTIGTGLGMGMIFNNQLYKGCNAGAGNFGHMIVGTEAKEVLESLVGASAIRMRAIELIKQGKKTSLRQLCKNDLRNLDAKMVFQAASSGDAISKRVVMKIAQALAIAISNVINLLAPEIVIIGGGYLWRMRCFSDR